MRPVEAARTVVRDAQVRGVVAGEVRNLAQRLARRRHERDQEGLIEDS